MTTERATPRTDALRLAREFLADPDKRAQVKVQLSANGWSKLADMIDEAVAVSRELLQADEELSAAAERIAELERQLLAVERATIERCKSVVNNLINSAPDNHVFRSGIITAFGAVCALASTDSTRSALREIKGPGESFYIDAAIATSKQKD